jgi:hypothetical protein
MNVPMGIFTLACHLDATLPLRYDEFSVETFRDPLPLGERRKK